MIWSYSTGCSNNGQFKNVSSNTWFNSSERRQSYANGWVPRSILTGFTLYCWIFCVMIWCQYCHYCQFCVSLKTSNKILLLVCCMNFRPRSKLPENPDIRCGLCPQDNQKLVSSPNDQLQWYISLIICCFILQIIADIVEKNDGIERCLEDEFVCFVQDSKDDKWGVAVTDLDLNFIQKIYSDENEDLLTQAVPHGSDTKENYLAESVIHQISYSLLIKQRIIFLRLQLFCITLINNQDINW